MAMTMRQITASCSSPSRWAAEQLDQAVRELHLLGEPSFLRQVSERAD